MKPYQSPDIAGHEAAIKDVLTRFLAHATQDPEFNPRLAVHEATAYVMQNLPPGVARVDGFVISPLLAQVIAELMTDEEVPKPVVVRPTVHIALPTQPAPAPVPAPSPAPMPVEVGSGIVASVKNFWKNLWR